MSKVSAKAILKAIGRKELSLYRGEGYWYFVLDYNAGLYETHSVYTMRLSDMTLDQWVAEGRAFSEEHPA